MLWTKVRLLSLFAQSSRKAVNMKKLLGRGTSIAAFLLIATLAISSMMHSAHGANAYKPLYADQKNAPALKPTPVKIDRFQTTLEQPWGMEILPGGRMLITEKSGRLWLYAANLEERHMLAQIKDVDDSGQGGLLDVAIVPGSKPYICLSYAQARDAGKSSTAVMCGRWKDGDKPLIEDLRLIWQQNPALDSTGHFGSRIVPQADGSIFITTGDRQNKKTRHLTQRLDTTVGKLVRLMPDGSVPRDNPFVGQKNALGEIWSLGHRNIQGAALDAQGRIWTIEHGPRGGDELNKPQAGKNYGWPIITYGIEYSGASIGESLTQRKDMEQPIYYWDPVIAPSGMAFYQAEAFPQWRGDVLIGGLGSQGLVRLKLQQDRVIGEERIALDARIRDVAVGNDGFIYLLTDAAPANIIRLRPAQD